MHHTPLLPLLSISTLLAAVSLAGATTISVNFTDNGSVDSTMLSSDVAGVAGADTRVANWNNAAVTGAGPGALGSLVDQAGSATGASLTWVSDLGNWRLPHAVSTGDDRMWKGYLDTNASSTLTVTGLSLGMYDVYVYFDGDNGTSWRVANFAIGAVADGGEDSEGANWGAVGQENENKVYQLPVAGGSGNGIWPVTPNNDEGNYVKLSGITGSSFTLTITSGATASGTRAPVNGFQIVQQIPEPSAGVLGLLGVAALMRRRRTGC